MGIKCRVIRVAGTWTKAEASGLDPSWQPDGAPNFRRRSDWCDEVIDKQDRGPIALLAA